MTIDIQKALQETQGKSPLEIIEYAIERAAGKAMVSTNFRPHEAVILHHLVQVQPDIPVLWIDHGYNTRFTYAAAEKMIQRMNLNIFVETPRISVARQDGVLGGIPSLDDQAAHDAFTEVFKLEPFRRGLKALNPTVWFTALRRDQTAFRSGMDAWSEDNSIAKVCPFLEWDETKMEEYIVSNNLPNETRYFDPTKVLGNRECGLHPGGLSED